MKYALIFSLFFLFAAQLKAQHETTYDQENYVICLVDSISPTEQVQFWRVLYINTGLYEDKNFQMSSGYSVAGTVKRCASVTGTATGSGGCLVQNKGFFTSLSSSTATYNANTVYSITIAAVSGTVTVNVDGAGAVTLVANETINYTAPNGCDYLQSQIVVDATSGTAHIARIQ